MNNTLEAILIAIAQGATELFPVSSLGHAVVLPALLHLSIDQRSEAFLPFLVMLHAGTALALLAYFWQDWWAIGTGLVGLADSHNRSESRRVFVRIVIATIPAVVIGFALEKYVRGLFGSPVIAASFLAVNGVMLLAGDWLRGRAAETRPVTTITNLDALVIGFWQCLALIPGISRSGSTIVGGLLRGIDHEGSAHFSFVIALPVIAGATVLEIPKLLRAGMPEGVLQTSLIAAVVAGATAFASTAFLIRYFRGHDDWALRPFAIYCIVAGLGSLGYLLLT